MILTIHRCPFCGKHGKVFQYDTDPEEIGIQFPPYAVRCKGCGTVGPQGDTEAEAVAKWNGRFGGDVSENPTTYEDGELEPGEKEATLKQLDFADVISAELGIEVPKRKSLKVFQKFISAHIDDYQKKCAKRLRSRYDYTTDDIDDTPFFRQTDFF